MDILKKGLAPITDQAWKEINEQKQKVLSNYLTARKFVDIDGPNGIEMAAVSTGRLSLPAQKNEQGVNYGIRQVMPLIETRKPFELDLWELDSINRGAQDANLDALEEAAKEIANFEEKVIYDGLEQAGIKGLIASSDYEPVKLPTNAADIIKTIGAQTNRLQRNAVEGPYTLVIAEDYWLDLINCNNGYPTIKQLETLLNGQIIVNKRNNQSCLVSQRGGDFELVIGQDISVGYHAHNTEKVQLFLTGSFTFRVLDSEAIIVLSPA